MRYGTGNGADHVPKLMIGGNLERAVAGFGHFP
jgi:hypothetical protein